jgi:glycosyltransferase involved in cell wall biosynthesis
MKNLPLVSVITIVKNGEQFIKDALTSIYNQDYPHFEVIVVDGHSTDQTLSIVNKFNPITIIKQKGVGVSDAYNTGIKAANADILAFLSSDDIWMPNKLAAHVGYMMDNPEIMFTNSLIEYFLEPGSEIPRGFRKELLNDSHPARIMETLVVRKEIFKKVGLFNTELSTAEDIDWYSRAQDFGVSNHLLDEILLKKRIHGHNTSMNTSVNNKNLMKVLRSIVKRKTESGQLV